MKHFLNQVSSVDQHMMSELLRQAREQLKKKQMNLAEMKTKLNLVCFNSSAMSDYVPKGMDALIRAENVMMEKQIPRHFCRQINNMVSKMEEPPFAYIMANIQTKAIEGYIDILFDLKKDFEYEPSVVTHFSDDELLEYLAYFISTTDNDGIERRIELYDERNPKPWKELSNATELLAVDKGSRPSAILDKPFFTDIQLRINKSHQEKIFGYPYGKLRTALGHFNRQRAPGGVVVRSKNTLFLTWKDIEGFKLAAVQSKTLIGVSIHGEYIPVSQFLTKNVGLNLVKKEDIDYFKMKIGKKPVDIVPDEITRIEINLDTQQTVMNRGVSKDDYHISRFKRLKLIKGDQSALIHKIVPFNRGESNFEEIQMFLGTRYTEYEKVRQIRSAKGDMDILASRYVMSCNLTAQLVLSSMNLLGILPLEPRCIGFHPKDIKNPTKMAADLDGWAQELRAMVTTILDISKTPHFTEHNFNRLSKEMRCFMKIEKSHEISGEMLEKVCKELEELTKYMDDFFSLDIYNKFQDDLECDTSTEVQEQPMVEESLEDPAYEHMDEKTKDFIGENFSFFKKREVVQSALLRVERMLFYVKHVREYAENPNFEPDLIVYTRPTRQVENYRFSSYPALALATVLNSDILKHDNEEDELLFVQMMRGFTKKVYDKAYELNKSFHHQYKHTLSELSFLVEEKLMQMQEELAFLENPSNKEAAYVKMLEKVTALFNSHLDSKAQNIAELEKERDDIQDNITRLHQELETLLREEISSEKLRPLLDGIPDRLETMRQEILGNHNVKKKNIGAVYAPYNAFLTTILNYFSKIVAYSDLFQKAMLIHQQQQMFQAIRGNIEAFFKASPEALKKKLDDLNQWQGDKKMEAACQSEIESLMIKIKGLVADLKGLPAGLFRNKEKEKGNLNEYLNYYAEETGTLIDGATKLQSAYLQLNNLQNTLFKKQNELIASKIKTQKNELMIQIVEAILQEPENRDRVEALLQQTDNVPKEIKEELGSLRTKMNEALEKYKPVTLKQNLDRIRNYETLLKQSDRRDRINDVAKDLVNFVQGLDMIIIEIAGEKEDYEFMKSQEANLEKIVMAKALPSTRVLLKTQYIPMVMREKRLLKRANDFLGEILSKADPLKKHLASTFFKNRHCFFQFSHGSFCVDTSKVSKNHTEKNVFSAFLLLAEHYKKRCAPAASFVKKIGLNKLNIVGLEGIKSRISQVWHGVADDRFLYLPSSLTLREVLELCDMKDQLVRENPKESKSKNNLVLIYIHEIDFEAIRQNAELLDAYHRAIMSNIFINIDGETIYNNRESIYEACIDNTFGLSNDPTSKQIHHAFLYDD